jgi:glutamate formiminotransferase/formiminotetrahydrofolate cyclodeaminase
MGLNDVSEFNLEEKVLGLPSLKDRQLINMKTVSLIDEVSRDTPAPGGGSVAAIASSLGAALGSMVAGLTISKKQYKSVKEEIGELGEKAQKVKDALIKAVDDDTNAFNLYFAALKMPKASEGERQARKNAMLEGLKKAVDVPYKTALDSLEAIKLCKRIAEIGNKNSVTDAGVGAEMAMAGLRGAVFNVLINLPGIEDKAFVKEMKEKCDTLVKEGEELIKKVRKTVTDTIEKM